MHKIVMYAMLAALVGGTLGAGPELDEMVVTATGIAEPRVNVPASVDVLDRDELRALANRNVDDGLRSVAGVSVLNSMGMGYGLPSQINIRGVPGLYATLLMLDGMPLNDAGSGFLSINEIPVSAVRRVEVVRGPFSALYGSDALGGVVNIMTVPPEESPTTEVTVRAGNESFWQGGVRGGAGTSALGWTLDLDARSIDNYLGHDRILETYLDPATQSYAQRWRPARNFDYEDQRAIFQLWTDIGETLRHRLQVRYFQSEGGYGQTDLAPLYPVAVDDTIESRTLFAGSDLEWIAGDALQARLRTFVRGQQRTVRGLNLSHLAGPVPVFVPSSSDTDSLDCKIDATAHYRLESQTLTVGADVYRNEADFAAARSDLTGARLPLSMARDEAIVNVGLYAQDAMTFSERWSAVAGVRGDAHSEFGEEVSPRAGVLFRATERTRIRTSVGRAFRAPTLTELFQPTIRFGSINFEANPDLDPEHVTATDLEIEQQVGAAVTVRAALFYNDMDDLIVKRVTGTTLTFQNASTAWSRGGELGVEWTVIEGLTAFVNGTAQESRDADTGYDLDHIPKTVLNAGVRLDRRRGRCRAALAVAGHRVGDRGYVDFSNGVWNELDPYWRTDASARLTWDDLAWVGVTADNLLDESYQEWPGVNPAPGRLWSVELGMRF